MRKSNYEITLPDKGFIYRVICDDSDGRPFYGLELEYSDNQKITLPRITRSSSEICEMLQKFAEGEVEPAVFQETAWDYIQNLSYERTFAGVK